MRGAYLEVVLVVLAADAAVAVLGARFGDVLNRDTPTISARDCSCSRTFRRWLAVSSSRDSL